MIGRVISHYEVLEKIGEGGMGVVYLAEDKKLHRKVALKFLPDHLTRNETLRRRFVQEAMAAASIEHPHIGAIYDIDEAEGHTFIAMEYIRGMSLRAAIREGKLPLRRALELGIQIADGLAKAHEHGVIHRDLKPDNVLLSEDGYPKVIDFGVAKLLEPLTEKELVSDPEMETWLKTESGMILGTASYMSPEQARGDSVDARSDVFSLGTLLYEVISGAAPFRRSSLLETLNAVANVNPPPLRLQGGEPAAELNRILGKCFQKQASARYQSMRELALDLRTLRDLAGSGDVGVFGEVSKPKRGWQRVAALGVVFVIAVVGFRLWPDRPPPGIGATGRPAIAVMQFQDYTGTRENRWLSDGVPDMLLTGLAQTPGLDVVSGERILKILEEVRREKAGAILRSLSAEVARRSGAGAIVAGSIYESGEEIRIDVRVEDVGSGRLLGAESVRGAEVFSLVDDLTARIRARLELQDRPVGKPIREITTTSLDAYHLYRQGLLARYNIRHRDAQRFFEEAVRLDPSFAKAYYQLWQTSATLGRQAKAEEYRKRLLENLDRLPERDRLLVEARNTWEPGGDRNKAVELAERLLERYPDHEEAYDLLVHIYSRENGNVDTILEHMRRWSKAFPPPGTSHYLNHYGYALLAKGLYTEMLTELFAGVAKARSGDTEGARAHLAAERESYDDDYLPHSFWLHTLEGEIAMASGDLARARAEFDAAEPESKMSFQLATPVMSIFANNLLFRDGVARIEAREGNLEGAIEIYRELNTPELSSKWVSLFEPRYVLEQARLGKQKGDEAASRRAYERFLELFEDADASLPELAEARAAVSRPTAER